MADRIPGEFNINFMGHRHLAVLFSAFLLVGSTAMLAVNGLKLGIDFTGGTLVELGYATPPDLDGIRLEYSRRTINQPANAWELPYAG